MNKYRTHNCSELNEQEIDKIIHLSGWLHRKRDHGNLLFIDLRDHYGITQCVIENDNQFFSILEKTKPESVLKISGKVVKRSEGTENLEIKTGKIEVSIDSVEILSNENRLIPGIDFISVSIFSPSSINRGYIKSSIVSLLSLTNRRMFSVLRRRLVLLIMVFHFIC